MPRLKEFPPLSILILCGVFGIWMIASFLNVIFSDRYWGDLLVMVLCGLVLASSYRRSPVSYRFLLLVVSIGFIGYCIHIYRMDSVLVSALLIYSTLGYTAFLALVTVSRAKAYFSITDDAPRRFRVLPVLALLYASAIGILFSVNCGFYAWDAVTGTRDPYAAIARTHDDYPDLGIEWKMHRLDNPGDLLPNGLDPADVNGDGWLDFVTNYEARGLIRVAFHPGTQRGLQSGDFWPSTNVGVIRNAESSAFGDLDGDGLQDIVGIHGVEGTSTPSGVTVFWGHRKSSIKGSAVATGNHQLFSWQDGGDIPSSRGGWHFLYTKTVDLDADGDLDIVVGGRASRMAFGEKEGIDTDPKLVWGGIRWFENPGPVREASGDLTKWPVHAIDPDCRSGHGFEFGDIDGDGDLDLANANSDFDTPEAEENVVWYANPGAHGKIRDPWPAQELYRGDEFYAKEQVAIADLDGDGRTDIIAVSPEDLLWFRNITPIEDGQPSFKTIVIEKHPACKWRARPIEIADLNGDGKNDIIGALIHKDGKLPKDKAALFWMEQTGDSLNGWSTHIIKWGDGFAGLNYVNGEKWDQIYPYDVDGDGDLDIVANCEEYNRVRSFIAVVWFENDL